MILQNFSTNNKIVKTTHNNRAEYCRYLFIYYIFTEQQPQNFGNCVTPTQQQGLCQYLRSCNSLFNLLLKGASLSPSERTHLSRSQCGYTNGSPLVCCPDSLQTGPKIGASLLPEPGVCGISTDNRIIGGTKTALDEFPWMVLLQYSKR